MDVGGTGWGFDSNGREDRHETASELEGGMPPYVVGREVTAILEAAHAAAEQITAKAREEAEEAAERITASARERAKVLQQKLGRFQTEIAELLSDRGEPADDAQGAVATPSLAPATGSVPVAQDGEGASRIVVEYGGAEERTEQSGNGVFGVEPDREAGVPAKDGGEESPAIQLLRQLVR